MTIAKPGFYKRLRPDSFQETRIFCVGDFSIYVDVNDTLKVICKHKDKDYILVDFKDQKNLVIIGISSWLNDPSHFKYIGTSLEEEEEIL